MLHNTDHKSQYRLFIRYENLIRIVINDLFKQDMDRLSKVKKFKF